MNKTVTYEIKLEKSLKVILVVFAIAILANAFQFSNPIRDAMAEYLSGDISISHSGSIRCHGCS